MVTAVFEHATPRDVYDVLLANSAHLLEDFLEAQGNR
jgi:hypothetical protein